MESPTYHRKREAIRMKNERLVAIMESMNISKTVNCLKLENSGISTYRGRWTSRRTIVFRFFWMKRLLAGFVPAFLHKKVPTGKPIGTLDVCSVLSDCLFFQFPDQTKIRQILHEWNTGWISELNGKFYSPLPKVGAKFRRTDAVHVVGISQKIAELVYLFVRHGFCERKMNAVNTEICEFFQVSHHRIPPHFC